MIISDFLITSLSFIAVIGILVTVHELGHFVVARIFGVRVLTFSIGFGKKIWGFSKNGTTYNLAIIPLGGYVAMLDEETSKEELGDLSKNPDEGNGISLEQVPLYGKFAILLAGPIANIVLAFFSYWLVFVVGVNGCRI